MIIAALTLAIVVSANAMSVSDYVLDQKSLYGKVVSVEGRVACLGDMQLCYLTDNKNESIFTMFDTGKLDRDQRKFVLNCSMRCSMTITGRVGTTTLGVPGIIATDVE